jgi:hypothetical protein
LEFPILIVVLYVSLCLLLKVICAFGRLGAMFGCDKYNIKPDLVSLAKVKLTYLITDLPFHNFRSLHYVLHFLFDF